MSKEGFTTALCIEFLDFVFPLIVVREDPRKINDLLDELGWNMTVANKLDELESCIRQLTESLDILTDLFKTRINSFNGFKDALRKIELFIHAFETLYNNSVSISSSDNVVLEMLEDLLNWLTIRYISDKSSNLLYLLKLLTIIEQRPLLFIKNENDEIVRIKNKVPIFRFDQIANALSEPKRTIADAYWANGFPDLDTTNKAAIKFFTALAPLLQSIGFTVTVGIQQHLEEIENIDPKVFEITEGVMTINREFFFSEIGDWIEYGLSIGLLPKPNGGPGVFAQPFGELNFLQSFGDWNLNLNFSGSPVSFQVSNEGLTFHEEVEEAGINTTFVLRKAVEEQPVFIIGNSTGTHLASQNIAISGGFSAQYNSFDYEVKLELPANRFVLTKDNSDGFIAKILPKEGLNAEFDLLFGYSKAYGFHLGSDIGFEYQIFKNLSFGPLSVKRIACNLVFDHGFLEYSISANVGAIIGPITANINQLGLYTKISFPEEGFGNLGLVDLDIDYKPPTGLGFVVNTELVKGGGYLEFRPERAEYIGSAELTIMDEISVKAVGIITTRLPDGREGYSFLLMIAVEFDPVQLGFGFTLSGVGGVIALHRQLDLEAIRGMVKTNDFDTVLFPQDPVSNIQTIITSLNNIFPLAEDYYSFGIMLRLGWGTPPLIDIKAGLMFQVPGWRIVLVGTAKAEITRTKAAEEGDQEAVKLTLLKLQVNFAATYDPARSLFAFDASLYQSELLGLALRGDVAIRLRGGNDPYFAICIGGFHPDYTPPEGLDLNGKLERISLTILDDNPVVKAEFYFALTSNTVQFGAEAVAKYEGWGFGVDGGLGFDALIKFSPLTFRVHVWGWMTVYAFDVKFFGVRLDGEVMGPYPLHFALTVTLDLWLWDVSFSFSFTKGKSAVPEVPSVEILPILLEALEDINAWQAQVNQRVNLLVATRKMEEELPDGEEPQTTDSLVVHPVGTISIRQDVMPSDIRIDKFGDKRP
ncbi:MAG: hypothetical protein KDD15_14455, partial [Lewinella sp.]|nr:hypothetical protein [Lewinella sp.]